MRIRKQTVQASATGAKNYGRAYDIDPESYFTREDLNEQGYRVAELVSLDLNRTVDYDVAWIEHDNNLTVDLTDGYSSSHVTVKVDMRRIRRPKDIIACYAEAIANESAAQFNDDESVITADEDVDSFDVRWDNQFGEPSTEVFTVDEFMNWLKEVMDFE